MRTLGLVLVAVSLLAIVPAVDAAPPQSGCHVQEEYVTEATVNARDPSDPQGIVEPGAPRPIECYY